MLFNIYYEYLKSQGVDDKHSVWRDYVTYGGMPFAATLKSHEDKSKCLQELFRNAYLADVLERCKLQNDENVLEDLLDIISSSIGSLTNPTKLANTFNTIKHIKISPKTISRYLDYFVDAFMK